MIHPDNGMKRTQDNRDKKMKMGKGSYGPAQTKSSGAYNGNDTFHGMSKGGNTAKKAAAMYPKMDY